MAKISFKNVSEQGLESSPYAKQLAGVRANEARYYWNKYKIEFETFTAESHPEILEQINMVLAEREMAFPYKPLEVAKFKTEDILHLYVFYQNGLSVNVMYDLENAKNRAVGFKLCEDMPIPEEFNGKFKFARQKSKLAGTIRGTFFKIKNEYEF